jgi:hypothetical protein
LIVVVAHLQTIYLYYKTLRVTASWPAHMASFNGNAILVFAYEIWFGFISDNHSLITLLSTATVIITFEVSLQLQEAY